MASRIVSNSSAKIWTVNSHCLEEIDENRCEQCETSARPAGSLISGNDKRFESVIVDEAFFLESVLLF